MIQLRSLFMSILAVIWSRVPKKLYGIFVGVLLVKSSQRFRKAKSACSRPGRYYESF